jgi:lipopolysaccharide transport system ATP-binding protein
VSDIAIRVHNLSKQYRIGSKQQGYKTLRDTLAETFVSPFRRAQKLLRGQPYGAAELDETIWALSDVSCEIKRGEVVGIIGRNGAGKTTLLKILSRITEPTEGFAEIHGRVGSLLEVGTGFHPELSGRENIYLNGAILGMRKAEIQRKFDEIVDFAEIDKFIDTPVKHYSSGMYVRLAFAVAAHMEPEILLVDEVLAVGDAAFQKKCLAKMGDVAKEGRTVLFVSHNMVALQSLCQRAVLLQEGFVVEQGDTISVINTYLDQSSTYTLEQRWTRIDSAPGNELVRLHSARILTDGGTVPDKITVWTPLNLEFCYWNLVPDAKLNLSLILYNTQGTIVFNTTSSFESQWHGKPFSKGMFRSCCALPGKLLNDGSYYLDLLIVMDTTRVLYTFKEILRFDVREDPRARKGHWYGKVPGVIRPQLNWQTEKLNDIV